jgi:hypothetical protein
MRSLDWRDTRWRASMGRVTLYWFTDSCRRSRGDAEEKPRAPRGYKPLRNLETLLQFTRAAGHEHHNLYAAVANYRALLEDMDETRSRSSTNWMRSAHGSTFRFPRGEYS